MNHRITCVFLLPLLLLASPVSAQQLVDAFDDWRVFTTTQNTDMVCYIASLPIKKVGNYNKRSEAYFLVTHKSSLSDEVSLSSGYRYKKGQDVLVRFGQKQFKLFHKEELAWAYDSAADAELVKEMKRGKDVVVKGQSWKGTFSEDTYSLKGFTAAYDRMKQLCE